MYFIYGTEMEKLKELRLMNVALNDRWYDFDEQSWAYIRTTPPSGTLVNLEKLTFYSFPPRFIATLLSRLPLARVRSLNIINKWYNRLWDEGTAIYKTMHQLAKDPGPISSLESLVKVEIRAEWEDVEALLDIFPDQLEQLEVFGLRIITSEWGGNEKEGSRRDPTLIPKEVTRGPIRMPKLRSLVLPDYEAMSETLLSIFTLPPSIDHLTIDLYRRHYTGRPWYHIEKPQLWVRILNSHHHLFASVTMLDVAIPRDAFDFKRDQKMDFPLLSEFPNVSVLTLRMSDAPPDYLGFVLQKGKDPRGKKFKASESRRLDRLNLHIAPTNAWAAGIDRVVKAYAAQRVPLPVIWLFYDATVRPGFSELNKEWLQTIPNLTVQREELLEVYSTLDASVTDPGTAKTPNAFEYIRNKIEE